MTDLLRILPSFPTAPFAALLPAIEHHGISTTDLLVLHPADIAKQTRLPILDLKRLTAAVHASLVDDVQPTRPLAWPPGDGEKGDGECEAEGDGKVDDADPNDGGDEKDGAAPKDTSPPEPLPQAPILISTLDDGLDQALGGGVPVGCVTEFAGESGAGKTQFLLSLCLAVQLPAPRGLGKKALYISTEAALSTQRLSQLLASNPVLRAVAAAATSASEDEKIQQPSPPSLDNILSTVTPDLESQDHILEYQVPVLLSRHDIGLIVLDSVAANYRAEFERQGSRGSNMAARSAQLVRLGAFLRDLARRHGIAVVVANQVADRFSPPPATPQVTSSDHYHHSMASQDSPLAARSMPPPQAPPPSMSSSMPFGMPDEYPPAHPALLLDHQQRWFTGWGDDPNTTHSLKTPSLGLVWSTQIACRIALFKRPYYGRSRRSARLKAGDDVEESGPTLKAWRRWMKVVFAPHVTATAQGMKNATEFEVTMGGPHAVTGQPRTESL